MVPPGNELLSQDVAYKVLSNPRRRAIIYLLRKADRPVDVMSLAESIASWEQDTPRDELTRGQRKRVYVSLYQTHIPKLESVGLITEGEETIRPTNSIYHMDSFLSSDHRSVPWYYLTTAASFGAVLLLGGLAMISASNTTSAYLVVAVLVGTIGASATGQFIERQQQLSTIPAELTIDAPLIGETV